MRPHKNNAPRYQLIFRVARIAFDCCTYHIYYQAHTFSDKRSHTFNIVALAATNRGVGNVEFRLSLWSSRFRCFRIFFSNKWFCYSRSRCRSMVVVERSNHFATTNIIIYPESLKFMSFKTESTMNTDNTHTFSYDKHPEAFCLLITTHTVKIVVCPIHIPVFVCVFGPRARNCTSIPDYTTYKN